MRCTTTRKHSSSTARRRRDGATSGAHPRLFQLRRFRMPSARRSFTSRTSGTSSSLSGSRSRTPPRRPLRRSSTTSPSWPSSTRCSTRSSADNRASRPCRRWRTSRAACSAGGGARALPVPRRVVHRLAWHADQRRELGEARGRSCGPALARADSAARSAASSARRRGGRRGLPGGHHGEPRRGVTGGQRVGGERSRRRWRRPGGYCELATDHRLDRHGHGRGTTSSSNRAGRPVTAWTGVRSAATRSPARSPLVRSS